MIRPELQDFEFLMKDGVAVELFELQVELERMGLQAAECIILVFPLRSDHQRIENNKELAQLKVSHLFL